MSPAPAIKAVAFDIGGVLVPTPLDEFTKVDVEYGLKDGTTMSFFRGGGLFAQCEVGALPFADFCARAVAQIEADQGITVPPDRLDAMMWAIMGDTVIAEMVNLVTEIKTAGLRTGLLSNIFAERDAWLRSLFAPGVIDVNCSSYVVGLRKPEPAIYRKLVELLGVEPAEIVVVDDFPENVEAAEAEELRGLLFTSEPQCRRQLKALGVDVAAA